MTAAATSMPSFPTSTRTGLGDGRVDQAREVDRLPARAREEAGDGADLGGEAVIPLLRLRRALPRQHLDRVGVRHDGRGDVDAVLPGVDQAREVDRLPARAREEAGDGADLGGEAVTGGVLTAFRFCGSVAPSRASTSTA
jgi:hypothetical protein